MQRYKKASVILLSLIAAIIALRFIVFVPLKRIIVLDRVILQKSAKFKELISLTQEYLDYRDRLQRFQGKQLISGQDADPQELLNKIALELNVNIKQEKSKGKSPEVKLVGLTLKELIKFLYRVEAQKLPLVIKKTVIKRNAQNRSRLDVTLQTLALRT